LRASFKISAIEFQGEKRPGLELSFHASENEEEKGYRRSNFNEDLLMSSVDITSHQYDLKASKRRSAPQINEDLEVSIDIEWPA